MYKACHFLALRHRRSQHEARGGNCLLLNFQIDNDFAKCFASSNCEQVKQVNDPNFNQLPQASFRSPKMYQLLKLSNNDTEFKHFPAVIPRTLVLGAKYVFVLRKYTETLELQQCNFHKNSWDITWAFSIILTKGPPPTS